MSDRITLADLLAFLWRGKLVILGFVLLALTVGFHAVQTAEPQYVVRMTLTPTQYNKYGAAPPAPSGGAAVRALLGLGGDRTDNLVDQFKALLPSVAVIQRLQAKGELLPRLFPEQWNPQTQAWHPPAGLRPAASRWLRELAGLPAWEPPGPAAAAERIAERLTVETMRRSDLFTVAFRHRDPGFAVMLLNALYQEADDYLRDRARQRAVAHVAYIQDKLRSVTNQENRAALIQLLIAEEGNAMLINAGVPYVVEILEPPVVPAQPVSPRPGLYLVAALGLGFLIGVAAWSAIDGARGRAGPPRRAACPVCGSPPEKAGGPA